MNLAHLLRQPADSSRSQDLLGLASPHQLLYAARQGCTHDTRFFTWLQGVHYAPEDCEMFLAIVPQRLWLAHPGGTQNAVTYNNSDSYPAWRVSFRVCTGGDCEWIHVPGCVPDWHLDPVATDDV